jgi:hypothetical protein
MRMKLNLNGFIRFLFVVLGLLLFALAQMGQEKRVQQRDKVGQTPPLVRIFRGRGRPNENLPRAEKLEIGGDKLGQILKGNTTLVRLSARTPFVNDVGYLIFRTGDPSQPNIDTTSTAEINGLIGRARFTGFINEIEIGLKPQPNKLYLVDVSVRHPANCDRCSFSIKGPDGHTEGWPANSSESQHLYFTFITNDADWYPLNFRGGTFEFDYCSVHEVMPL